MPSAARTGSAPARGPEPFAVHRPPGQRLVVPAARGTLLPNLLLAGVTHAGAAALSQVLAGHPEIVQAAPQRVDHFTPLRYGKPVDAPLEDYDDHFEHARGERYRLETSPVYFDGGALLVGTVQASLPGARVVVLLRDPAERLWTGYLDKVARGRLPRAMTFATFVERCQALRTHGTDRFEGNRYYRTLSSGFYVEHLPGWLDAFGPRARVVFAEDLAEDRDATVAGLLAWLGLPAADRPAEVTPDGDPHRPGTPATLTPGTVTPATLTPTPLTPAPFAPDAFAPEPSASGPFPAPPERRSMLARLFSGAPATPAAGTPTAGAEHHAAPDGALSARPSERTLARVRALYAVPNRDLAGVLRAHHDAHARRRDRRAGRRDLPGWLSA